MDILLLNVEYQNAAVVVVLAEGHAVTAEQILKRIVTENAEVARDDKVVVVGCPASVLKVCLERFVCRGSHGTAHVVCILYARVDYLSRGHMRNERPVSVAFEYRSARARDRPLCRWCTLAAVLKREAVLPLGRAKVRACKGADRVRKASVNGHCAERERLAHSRASAVKPKVGDIAVLHCKRRAHALI